jgi:hypothetical protein
MSCLQGSKQQQLVQGLGRSAKQQQQQQLGLLM